MSPSQHHVSRRAFLRTAAAGAAGLAGMGAGLAQEAGQAELPRRALPGTDLELTVLGYGAEFMVDGSVPAYLIEQGLNYIDTAAIYQNGQSEAKLAPLLKEHGERLVVTTKWHPPVGQYQQPKEWFIEQFEGCLERLQVESIPLLFLHDCRSPVDVECPTGYEAFRELREAGKVKWYGMSTHLQTAACVNKARELGCYDVLMVAYNFMSTPEETQAMQAAHEAGKGLIAIKMGKPLTEGQDWCPRATEEQKKALGDADNLFTASLKWTLSQPFITSCVTWMENYDQCDQNLAAAQEMLTTTEAAGLDRYARVMASSVCRGCADCRRACPQDLAVPDMLRFATYYGGYGQHAAATRHYRHLPTQQTFAACTRCGRCEQACPHGLPILERLERAHRRMA